MKEHNSEKTADWMHDNDLSARLERLIIQESRLQAKTLQRRLKFFGITRTKEVSRPVLIRAVAKELAGPGQLLGYRAMYNKIRQRHGLLVRRDEVYNVMQELDPKGLAIRKPCAKKLKPAQHFVHSNFVHSLDGHDKMMGFQNHTFPIAIYGCIDTCSRKILWVKVWTSNSNPNQIARFYLEYLLEQKSMATFLRIDRGTETGTMATLHAYLRKNHGDMEPIKTVMYGPSTSNQIERWWKELHERLEKYFKHQLRWLKEQCLYDPYEENDRLALAYIMVPVMQREVDEFVEVVWNTHRIRGQKDAVLPNGVPNHIYDFPEAYGLENCAWRVSDEQLKEAAEVSGILSVVYDDYLPKSFRELCCDIIPNPEKIVPPDCAASFRYLKDELKKF